MVVAFAILTVRAAAAAVSAQPTEPRTEPNLEPADGHSSCTASATTKAGAEIVTCEAWASDRSLTGLALEPAPSGARQQTPLFIDVQAVAYSLPPVGAAPPRNATIASIVSGAANRHNISADEAVAMAVVAAKASPTQLDLVLFPECFLYDGDNAEFCGAYAATGKQWDCNGPHVSACRRAALATKAYVVCPFYELANSSASQSAGPSFNTAVLLDREGSVVGKYRKNYPTSEIFGSPAGELDEGILPGNLGVPVFDTDFGRVAILICWDFDFPELWYAAAAGGAELVLWPSAGKGGQTVYAHALTHGIHIASNGNGEFYDRLGRVAPLCVNVSYTLPPRISRALESDDSLHRDDCFHPPCKHHAPEPIQITAATVDLDQSLIFYGGPGAKRQAIDAFLATAQSKHGVAKVFDDPVSKIALISCVNGMGRSGGCSSRAALKQAGIETRREEQNRNRLTNNRMRPRDVP